MPGIENYLTFIISGILLNITPGQDSIYIISRSIAQGKKAGIASALGVATGCLIHTLFAALGLSAILQSSPHLFTLLKYVGAAYLVFLGIQMIFRSANSPVQTERSADALSITSLYKKGILTNVFNPKVALFFLAFLPQFIQPHNAHGILPFLILGITFVVTGTAWCLVLAYAAAAASARLRSNEKIQKVLNRICGSIFVALGLNLFLSRK